MNIREALAKEHTKRNTEAIVKYMGSDAALFKQLIEILRTEDYRLVQRASWVLSYVVTNTPDLINPHLGTLLNRLHKPHHDAFKRNVFRLLRGMKVIPEKHHAAVIDHCMTAITDMQEPPAIRTFGIHIMGKLTLVYPELAGELKALLEPLTAHDQASIRSGARAVMKQITK